MRYTWIDLAAIFDLLSRGLGLPAFLPNPLELAIRQEARLIRAYAADKRHYANAVLTVFDQLVPGALYNLRRFQHAHPDLKPLEPLVRSHPLERQRFQILVEHCPDPYALLAMTPDGLAHFFRDHGLRCGLKTAHQVNRVFFALLRDDKPFHPPGIADYPAFCRHWQPQINAYFNRGRKPHSPSPRRNPGR